MGDCSIRVVVRFRPFNDREKALGTDKSSIQFKYHTENKLEIAGSLPAGQTSANFDFDRVFPSASNQEEVFDIVAKNTVKDVLSGFNGTIFAYGQTGAGKSWTMMGSLENESLRGVIPRATASIFDSIQADASGAEYQIRCSFLELYNEMVQDLFDTNKKNLQIRESPTRGIYVEGLTEECVSQESEIYDLLELGSSNRVVSSTKMNAVSSRSHSVFIIFVQQRMPDGSSRSGRLNLVDLAGSEKVAKTGASGHTLEEAKKINQSLSALGNCIHALTDSKRGHIPYRDSKLTRILQDSLGGNTKTTLMCACSPHEDNVEETISTLRFGQRAKTIKNIVKANVQKSAAELQRMVDALRKELLDSRGTVVVLEKQVAWYKSFVKEPMPKELDSADVGSIASPALLAIEGGASSEELARANEETDALRDELAEAKSREQSQKEEIVRLNEELTKALAAAADRDSLASKLAEERKRNDASSKKAEDELDVALEELQLALTARDTAQSQLAARLKELESLKAENKKVAEEARIARADQDALFEEIESLETQKADVQSKYQQVLKEFESVKQCQTQLEADVSYERTNAETLMDMLHEAEAEEKKATLARIDTESELKKRVKIESDLRAQVSKLTEQISCLHCDLDDAHELLQMAENEIVSLQQTAASASDSAPTPTPAAPIPTSAAPPPPKGSFLARVKSALVKRIDEQQTSKASIVGHQPSHTTAAQMSAAMKTLEAQLQQLELKNLDLEAHIQKLELEKGTLEAKADSERSKAASNGDKLKLEQTKTKSLESELGLAQRKLEQSKKAEAQIASDDAAKKLSVASQKFQQQVQDLTAKCDQLRAELDQLREEKMSVEAQASNDRAQASLAAVKLSRMDAKLAESAERMSTLESTVDGLERQKESLLKELQKATETQAKLEADARDAQDLIDNLRKQLQTYISQRTKDVLKSKEGTATIYKPVKAARTKSVLTKAWSGLTRKSTGGSKVDGHSSAKSKLVQALQDKPPYGILHIKAIEASELVAADTAIFGKGTSDPFVRFLVGSERAKTKVIEKTLTPKWNESFFFTTWSSNTKVTITVWDKDIGKADDPLGSYELDLAQMWSANTNAGAIGFTENAWYRLKDVPTGQLHLETTLICLEPRDWEDGERLAASLKSVNFFDAAAMCFDKCLDRPAVLKSLLTLANQMAKDDTCIQHFAYQGDFLDSLKAVFTVPDTDSDLVHLVCHTWAAVVSNYPDALPSLHESLESLLPLFSSPTLKEQALLSLLTLFKLLIVPHMARIGRGAVRNLVADVASGVVHKCLDGSCSSLVLESLLEFIKTAEGEVTIKTLKAQLPVPLRCRIHPATATPTSDHSAVIAAVDDPLTSQAVHFLRLELLSGTSNILSVKLDNPSFSSVQVLTVCHSTLVTGDTDNRVTVFDLSEGKRVAEASISQRIYDPEYFEVMRRSESEVSIVSMCLTMDAGKLAVCNKLGHVFVLDCSDLSVIAHDADTDSERDTSLTGLADYGQIKFKQEDEVALLVKDKYIKFMATNTLETKNVIPAKAVHSFDLSPTDWKALAMGGSAGLLLCFDMQTNAVSRVLTGHHGDAEVTHVAFSPDGSKLLSLDSNRWAVVIHHVSTGQVLGKIELADILGPPFSVFWLGHSTLGVLCDIGLVTMDV